MAHRIIYFTLLMITGFLLIESCGQPNDRNEQSFHVKKELPDEGSIGALPLTADAPADNPVSPEKIELGRLLFYDPILSGNKDVSCASCHRPEFGYAEDIDLSIGVNGKGLGEKRIFTSPNDIPFTKRNAQTLLNTAFNGIDAKGNYDPATAPMFWDLRARGLEDQALHPIKQMEEMRGRKIAEDKIVDVVVKRLNAIPAYRRLFARAFNEPDAVNAINLARALASFQRSLLANNTRFDEYMRGNTEALSSGELEGMNLFMHSGCARCHSGPMLSDYKVHVLGIADNEKLGFVDSGYQNSFAFRTPSLRNLRFTAPYMHSGKIKTLDDVLTFYEDLHGKDLPNNHVKKEQLDTLAANINVEFKDISRIIEFLNTLNDPDYDKKIPAAVPSGLPVGGNIQ